MTEPLNFCAKAIADLSEIAAMPHIAPQDKHGLRFICELLRRAQVFVLPDAGELLDRAKPYPEVAPQIFKPPFPVVALEYCALDRGTSDPLYESSLASKRIALAWQWDGISPAGFPVRPEMPDGGVMVASVSYFEEARRWMPIAAAILLPFEGSYSRVPGELPEHTRAFVQSGRMTEAQARAPALEASGLLPLMPSLLISTAEKWGWDRAASMVAADLMDEVNAYRDLCLTLACNNVSSERHAQPEKLNRARIKAGKPPLKDWHILKINGQAGNSAFGSENRGVRSHLRRGHVRRLGPQRITWVNSCMVSGSRSGFVGKDYSVAAAR